MKTKSFLKRVNRKYKFRVVHLYKKAQTEIQVTEVVSYTLKGHLEPVDLLSPVMRRYYLKVPDDTSGHQ